MREADEQAYGLVKKLDVPNGLGVFARSPGLLTALLARLAARSTRPSDDWGESATSPATADAAQFFLEAGGITEGVVSKIPGVPKCCDDDRSVVHDFGCVVPCSDGVCAADGVGTYAAGRLSRQQQQQVLHRRRLGNIVARQARYDRPRRLETMTLRDELEAKLRAI